MTTKKPAKSKKPTVPAKAKKGISDPVESALDQPRPSSGLEKTLQAVDSEMNKAIRDKDPDFALTMIAQLAEANRISGLSLAKALYMAKVNWDQLSGGFGDFEEAVFERVGKHPETIRRYILAWEFLQHLPPRLPEPERDMLMNQPMQSLIAMAQYSSEHGMPDIPQLQELAHSEDTPTLRDKMRELRGIAKEDKDFPRLVLRKDGTLEVWRAKKTAILGFLRVSPSDMEDGLRAQTVSRVMRLLRVQKE